MTTVSVKKGESITLDTRLIEIKGYDLIKWKFKDQLIAELNKGTNQFLTPDTSDERFKGRLQLHPQIVSLIISDSKTTDSGVYHLNMISSSHTIQRTISVTVSGVFGVENVNVTVSVMEGDSVTLNSQTEIPEDETTEWWFGENIIAQINKAAGLFSTSEGDNVGFKGKLKLDHQNGSLTITNIKTGLYTLKISSKTLTPDQKFSVTVSDVVESLSVTEGDTVTLHTGVTDIQRDDQILWRFGGQVLNSADARWSNTGDLTITNIRRDQSGDYKVEINTNSMILQRKFRINTLGKMKTVSVKEGESIPLDTRLLEIKGYDLIMWKFKDQLIAELNKGTNQFLTHDTSAGGRFNGRLKQGQTTVSLIISDSRITDSEDYSLHMIGSNSSYTVQRNISVTVSVSDKQTPDPGVSEAVAWIFDVLLVFAVAGVVIYYHCKISKLKRPKDVALKNGPSEPLKKKEKENVETANSDNL